MLKIWNKEWEELEENDKLQTFNEKITNFERP